MHALAEPGAGAVLFFSSITGLVRLMHPWVSKIAVMKMKNNDVFVKIGWEMCGHMSHLFGERFLCFSLDGGEIEEKNRKTFKVKLKDWRV